MFSGLSELTNGIFGYFGAEANAENTRQAGQVQAAGYQLQAEGYDQAITLNTESSEFNLGVESLNNQRKLDSMGQQFERSIAAQMSAVASTNLDISSKSALMVHNQTADFMNNSIKATQANMYNQQQSQMFQTAVQNNQYANEAIAANYNAQSSAIMADNKANQQSMMGAIGLAGSIFGML